MSNTYWPVKRTSPANKPVTIQCVRGTESAAQRKHVKSRANRRARRWLDRQTRNHETDV